MNSNTFLSSNSKLNSLIQVSSGNIPTQAAHSMQITKMAEALSKRVDNFELITSGDFWSFVTRAKLDLKHWYGLNSDFSLVRIPINLKQKYPFPENYYGGKFFYLLSTLYILYKSPTLVYTRTPAVVKILLKIGVPIVWELHEIAKAEVFQQEILCNDLLIAFVTTSEQLGKIAVKKGLPSQKLIVEPNAVALDKFLPYQSQELAKAKIAWESSKPLIVYTGHLYDYKGMPTVLEIAESMPCWDFVVVGGWQNDIERIKELCCSKGLNNVYLKGHVSQALLSDYLYAADVLILPTSSLWEQSEITSPLKLFDYMASQRPVVASNLPNF